MRGTKQGFRRTIASLLVFSLCIAAVPALPAKADNKINELQNQIKEEQKKTERYEGPEKTDGKQYQFPEQCKNLPAGGVKRSDG